jgi:hypothetical protein
MAWIRLDDHFDEDPRLVRVGPLGLVLWLSGLAYCLRNRTDGFIPWSRAETLVSWSFLGMVDREGEDLDPPVLGVTLTRRNDDDPIRSGFVAALLVDAGLWEEVEDGYRVAYWGADPPRHALPSGAAVDAAPQHLTVLERPRDGGV